MLGVGFWGLSRRGSTRLAREDCDGHEYQDNCPVAFAHVFRQVQDYAWFEFGGMER